MRRGAAAALAAAFTMLSMSAAAEAPAIGPDSGRPVPRFASLAGDEAHGRHGPGLEHHIDWVYQRAGLPIEITAESGPWRRVIDPAGAQVWMHTRNLDERRTIYVKTQTAIRGAPRTGGRTIAILESGVIGALTGCEGDWRRVAVGGRVGWAQKDALWGAGDCPAH